ncbi:MAG: hypothetical protein U5L11_04930 [Arhodomonas sp.]|nr:hypothetical protein [Arhodomonas sp.]
MRQAILRMTAPEGQLVRLIAMAVGWLRAIPASLPQVLLRSVAIPFCNRG